ncbi:MAG: hypothetical protein QNJ81_14415 [Acidimicrobiia bacterium]|nr:hypothetical protein [Acidimicrobiia bacterium]
MKDRISSDLLDLEVTGPGVAATSLRAAIGTGPTLLVFLRHFG